MLLQDSGSTPIPVRRDECPLAQVNICEERTKHGTCIPSDIATDSSVKTLDHGKTNSSW